MRTLSLGKNKMHRMDMHFGYDTHTSLNLWNTCAGKRMGSIQRMRPRDLLKPEQQRQDTNVSNKTWRQCVRVVWRASALSLWFRTGLHVFHLHSLSSLVVWSLRFSFLLSLGFFLLIVSVFICSCYIHLIKCLFIILLITLKMSTRYFFSASSCWQWKPVCNDQWE